MACKKRRFEKGHKKSNKYSKYSKVELMERERQGFK